MATGGYWRDGYFDNNTYRSSDSYVCQANTFCTTAAPPYQTVKTSISWNCFGCGAPYRPMERCEYCGRHNA